MRAPPAIQHATAAPSGSAMILVLVAISIAFVMGLTFMASSASVTGVAQTMHHHAQARQVAESGLTMALNYVQRTPDWRDARSNGAWFTDYALFGGSVSVSGQFPQFSPIIVNDPSFEQATGQLANPLLNPPMSGTIGGWEVQRTATVVTGPTVPQIGVIASANATNGSNVASISFGAAVNGTGTFGQTLATSLQPQMSYELSVDILPTGLAIESAGAGFRLLAAGTVVASSEHTATLQLPPPPGGVPTPPSQPPTAPEVESVTTMLGLSGGFSRYTLHFVTSATVPAGLIRLELYAQSQVGATSSVLFDNVHLNVAPNDPLVLTAVGRHGDASHKVVANVAPASVQIVKWSEP